MNISHPFLAIVLLLPFYLNGALNITFTGVPDAGEVELRIDGTLINTLDATVFRNSGGSYFNSASDLPSNFMTESEDRLIPLFYDISSGSVSYVGSGEAVEIKIVRIGNRVVGDLDQFALFFDSDLPPLQSVVFSDLIGTLSIDIAAFGDGTITVGESLIIGPRVFASTPDSTIEISVIPEMSALPISILALCIIGCRRRG